MASRVIGRLLVPSVLAAALRISTSGSTPPRARRPVSAAHRNATAGRV